MDDFSPEEDIFTSDRPEVLGANLAVATLSEDLRGPALQGSLGEASRRVSLRSFYAFDRLREALGAPRAARLIFGDVDGQAILDALAIGSLE